jgi:uncharacterized OsmC-like protein
MTIAETPARNGVDTATLFATIDAVAGQRDLARFQFRASNRWVNGTHSRSTISTFRGAGQEQAHISTWEFDADHPMVLTGKDGGPTPVEFVLVALASCLTAGIANIASARGVELESVESTVEGDIDLQGILGLSDEVRNGYEKIRVAFRISADAPEDKIRSIVDQSRARSAVFDIITGAVPVDIDVTVG